MWYYIWRGAGYLYYINSSSFLRKGGDGMVRNITRNMKQTSKSVASKASKVLHDGRFSKISKSVAGSALSQTKKSSK